MPLLPIGLLGVVTVPLGILAVVVYFRLFPPILFGDADYYASALPALVGDAPLYDPRLFAPHVLPLLPFGITPRRPPSSRFLCCSPPRRSGGDWRWQAVS